MIEVVDIIVRGDRFSERYDTQRTKVDIGDYCLVESSIGIQIAKVVSEARVMKAPCVDDKLPKIIRKASSSDLDILKNLEQIEQEASGFCLKRINELRLDMKLIKVVFAFDRSKGLFMFTADGRVDFRELVRDLAHTFKTRIEMKQIGIRDEARLLGGIGNCGCSLCCVTFLREFHPVSIKMAKDQGLSLIPSKISGLCGRLMCCLQYEHHHYAEQVKNMPKMGKRVMTAKGEGRVRQLNILKGLVLVDLQNGELEEFLNQDVIPYHRYLEQKELEDKERALNKDEANPEGSEPSDEKPDDPPSDSPQARPVRRSTPDQHRKSNRRRHTRSTPSDPQDKKVNDPGKRPDRDNRTEKDNRVDGKPRPERKKRPDKGNRTEKRTPQKKHPRSRNRRPAPDRQPAPEKRQEPKKRPPTDHPESKAPQKSENQE